MVKIDECIKALTSVLGESATEISLHEPLFEGNEWEYVKACLDSGWVSSVGEYVTRFEKQLMDYTGSPFAVVVVNGTSALHMSLILVGVKPHDEVLVPSLTFVATANAVTFCHAIPHFVDSNSENLGIDILKLKEYLKENTIIKDNVCINKKTLRRIKAIIPVHIFGHPVDMDSLHEISQEFHLSLVEDASESLGSFYKGKHTGNFSDVACLSFNGNKIITCGGGGAILTSHEHLAKRAKHLTTTAKRSHRWEFYHDEVGYNYRMPNLNAALGCAQLENLPSFIEKKRKLAENYLLAFSTIKYSSILRETSWSRSNYWLNALVLEKPDREFIENIIELAHERQYSLRGLWTPLDKLPMYQDCPKMDLATTHSLFERVICLPSSVRLGKRYDA